MQSCGPPPTMAVAPLEFVTDAVTVPPLFGVNGVLKLAKGTPQKKKPREGLGYSGSSGNRFRISACSASE